ncbi:MAG: LPXTG cell wall anchor domain-containing protein, partial [Eubacteriales bacterium]|nr:LPXTG cell wall anchor domain-containing protein [Eubacteriales bacterium]
KPKTIKTADGKEYELVKVHEDSATEQGKIVGGKTLEVTYVYKLKSGGENPDVPSVTDPKGNQNNDPGNKAGNSSNKVSKPGKIPKTGDVNDFFLHIGLLAFASVGLVFVLKKRVQR